MKQLLTINQAAKLAKSLKADGSKIVLAGGCFDILHLGHVTFLEKAKACGDALIILLESDQSIKKMKGNSRPINPQAHRARLLASLKMVDYVILLPEMKGDNAAYDKLILKIRPDIIAITKGDRGIDHKTRQAVLVGAQLLEVTESLPEHSTTKILEVISLKASAS